LSKEKEGGSQNKQHRNDCSLEVCHVEECSMAE